MPLSTSRRWHTCPLVRVSFCLLPRILLLHLLPKLLQLQADNPKHSISLKIEKNPKNKNRKRWTQYLLAPPQHTYRRAAASIHGRATATTIYTRAAQHRHQPLSTMPPRLPADHRTIDPTSSPSPHRLIGIEREVGRQHRAVSTSTAEDLPPRTSR